MPSGLIRRAIFGDEIEQRADGAAGLLARLQFQHLPEQNQHGDDGRSLEIDGDRAVMAAHRRREQRPATAVPTML